MSRLFGTDGVRGIAGTELTAELAMDIGISLAYILKRNNDNVKVIIGSDTRISRDMLVSALSAGLCSGGVEVINVGIIPTPAISFLVSEFQVQAGVMVTASHNPYEYNGIKIFNENGFKLDDNLEDEIQEIISNINKLPKNNKVGRIIYDNRGVSLYIDHLLKTKGKELDFSKYRVAIDCSNGSSSVVAPTLFHKLGCKYTILNNNYDGENINKDCGSTHIEYLQKYVVDNKFDLGFAFDGDADRCLCVDEEGKIIDGDYILAITSKYMKDNNRLNNNTVVGTVMSNLGFVKYCKENDINFISTKVGDRYVLEEININNYNLGGEQSGHIIFRDYASTGDGELTAIQIMNVIASNNKSLSSLSKIMKKYPQVMENVKVSNERKNEFYTNSKIKKAIKEVEAKFKDDGRVLVRPSGTEPLIRVMIEGSEIETITKSVKELASKIKDILG